MLAGRIRADLLWNFRFEEFSLNQWLAVSPPGLVQVPLNVGDEFIKALDKGHTPIRVQ